MILKQIFRIKKTSLKKFSFLHIAFAFFSLSVWIFYRTEKCNHHVCSFLHFTLPNSCLDLLPSESSTSLTPISLDHRESGLRAQGLLPEKPLSQQGLLAQGPSWASAGCHVNTVFVHMCCLQGRRTQHSSDPEKISTLEKNTQTHIHSQGECPPCTFSAGLGLTQELCSSLCSISWLPYGSQKKKKKKNRFLSMSSPS